VKVTPGSREPTRVADFVPSGFVCCQSMFSTLVAKTSEALMTGTVAPAETGMEDAAGNSTSTSGSRSGYGATVRIERVVDEAAVEAGAELFDEPPDAAATEQFLSAAGHHLLFAYDDDDDDAAVVGMISGVETTHPDKGTEMFLYELGVAPSARKRGIATELVRALAALAKHRGCYGMWVAVDMDNAAALTYRRAGAQEEAACVVQSWNCAQS